ncbi:beta-lactamase-like protein [Mariannaea sp. PMI_226]|nr:beta-lactamase-like protein [Mariannaea sp. PMI_226]
MAPYTLAEVDSMEIAIVVTDEIDQFSHSQYDGVKQVGSMSQIPMDPLRPNDHRHGANAEMKMSNICCGAFGFSAAITVTKDNKKHTLLFDTGPEEDVWERNAMRMRLNAGAIEHILLSHWHRDHSGGLLRAVSMINAQKDASQPKVIVDVHPDRPEFRGIATPLGDIFSMEANPTFDAIRQAGAVIVKEDQVHTVLEDTFLISGSIPRTTAYETGIRGGVRFDEGTSQWVSDSQILDERLVMCNVKGKGLVVFTGCSHAGVINTALHAQELGGDNPLYTIVGGYHLADAPTEKLESTMADMKKLRPQVLMPGHCTGWRFKFLINQEMPTRLVPCFSGSRYVI